MTNNNFFFTITINQQEIHFDAREYTFTIPNSEQKLGTRGHCRWYYDFDPNLDLDCKWVSWNQNHNEIKTWQYLLLKVNATLYSGFINKSRDKDDTYYCKLEPLPARQEEIFVYQ
jgi:hypothetical protein